MGDVTPVCASPIKFGPNKGRFATGSPAGYDRHRFRGEPPCEPCRLAHSEDVRRLRAARVDQYRERARLRNAANPQPNRERARRWAEANRDRRDENVRRWRAQNPERVQAIRKRWSEANPEALAAIRRATQGRRRKAPTIPFTAEQLTARMAYFGNRCWMCGGAFEHVDHVKPLARGGFHCLANLRPACGRCNLRKSATWPLPNLIPVPLRPPAGIGAA